MDRGRRFRDPPPESSVLSSDSVVPPRAVLTELARGFLLTHDSDPARAKLFAATFLQERAGRRPPERVVPALHMAEVRRPFRAGIPDSRVFADSNGTS
jgi:hypothetical protein